MIGFLGLVSFRCGAPPKEPVAAEPAAASTAPGSEGDWCGEHGVPESVCTICNPKLVPVYQAKGDWCAEHELPESVCPICHPELGGRPPAEAAAADEPPADGLEVKLASPQVSRIAGIDTAKGRPIEGAGGFVAPARLTYDAARRAEINARSAGVVRSVLVDLGSRVRKGAPLIVVDSPEVGSDRSRLTAARARVDVASAELDRERRLYAEGMTPEREVQVAEGDLADARAEVEALEAAASVVGAAGDSGRYTLHAPLSGVVVRREATVGRQVDSEEVLLEIVDASVLWAVIDVPEPRVGEAGIGSDVTLTFDGLAGRTFRGTIASIAPEVDPRTRTATARVRLTNEDGALRANMYGRARILGGSAAAGVAVPIGAVQRAGGVDVVFVRLSETTFQTRHVQTGARADGWVEVTRGLASGEDVVTIGSFLLKTETLKGSIGAGCCE